MAGATGEFGIDDNAYGVLSEVIKKEVSNMGLGDKIANILDSMTMMNAGPLPTSITVDMAKRSGSNLKGIMPPETSSAVAPTPNESARQGAFLGMSGFSPTQKVEDTKPVETAPAPNIYGNLRGMSHKQLVDFMSKDENRGVSGIGWIGDLNMGFDPKTGKSLDPNFKRLVEDPATRKPEKITVDELEARGKYLQGLGMYEHGIGAREQAAATKTATQEYKTMELQRKASADMQGLIEKFGKTVEGTVDPSIALYRMGKAGIPLPESLSAEDSKRFRAAMDEQTKPLRDTLTEAAAKKRSPLTSGEIFTITNIFEKSRGFSI